MVPPTDVSTVFRFGFLVPKKPMGRNGQKPIQEFKIQTNWDGKHKQSDIVIFCDMPPLTLGATNHKTPQNLQRCGKQKPEPSQTKPKHPNQTKQRVLVEPSATRACILPTNEVQHQSSSSWLDARRNIFFSLEPRAARYGSRPLDM